MRNSAQDRARSFFGSNNSGAKRTAVRIEASASEATLWIYNDIGTWYVESESIARELAVLDVATINVRINSRGGDVFEGLAIYNALARHSARIVVYVDGLAASIASLVAMAGDEIHIAEGAFIMIHNPWVAVIGDARELRKLADTADQICEAMIGIYAERTGQSREEIARMMDEETWFNAESAVESGFADDVDRRKGVASASFDLSIFNHVPAPLAAKAGDGGQPERKIATIRDLEKFLRNEGGLSHAEARSIAASGYKPQPEPRDEDGGLSELVPLLRARAALAAP